MRKNNKVVRSVMISVGKVYQLRSGTGIAVYHRSDAEKGKRPYRYEYPLFWLADVDRFVVLEKGVGEFRVQELHTKQVGWCTLLGTFVRPPPCT